jgi:hypothetical protein
MTPDVITGWARTAFRFAMVQHPTRTSLGMAGGVFVGVLVDIFRPTLTWLNTNALTDFRLAISGAFITNVIVLFKRDDLPEDIENDFKAIRLAVESGKLSQAHQKLLYLNLAQSIVTHSHLSKKTKTDVERLTKSAHATAHDEA